MYTSKNLQVVRFPQTSPSSVEKADIRLSDKAAHGRVNETQRRLGSASHSPGVVRIFIKDRWGCCCFSRLESGRLAPPVTFTARLIPAGSDYLAALSGRQRPVMWLLIAPSFKKRSLTFAALRNWVARLDHCAPFWFISMCIKMVTVWLDAIIEHSILQYGKNSSN